MRSSMYYHAVYAESKHAPCLMRTGMHYHASKADGMHYHAVMRALCLKSSVTPDPIWRHWKSTVRARSSEPVLGAAARTAGRGWNAGYMQALQRSPARLRR